MAEKDLYRSGDVDSDGLCCSSGLSDLPEFSTLGDLAGVYGSSVSLEDSGFCGSADCDGLSGGSGFGCSSDRAALSEVLNFEDSVDFKGDGGTGGCRGSIGEDGSCAHGREGDESVLSDIYDKCEILAPAGSHEQLEAAVKSGADAVYLGFGGFNARRNAENFTAEKLCDTVGYCHARGVKVHAALNIIIKQDELKSAERDIKTAAECGVDAVIVQDIGLAAMIKKCAPDMPMHASTQLSVHNLSGVKELEKLGFSRAVLARELSLDEIAAICAGTDMQIETFIHGALCMCVSGQCYMSSLFGQRSGNRGLCAQPCRLDFKNKTRGHALSLKDMSHLAYIRELAKVGVCSFKIEGRMKRPEYVACAVDCAKKALEGKPYDEQTLKAVFSRSGFTDRYITGRISPDMFGYREQSDVEATASVLKRLHALYKNECRRVPLYVDFKAKKGEECRLEFSDGNFTSRTTLPPADEAITRSSDEQAVSAQLGRLGGTPFYVDKYSIETDQGLMIPASSLNAARRFCADELMKERSKPRPYDFSPFDYDEKDIGFKVQANEKSEKLGDKNGPKVYLRLLKKEQMRCLKRFMPVILPIDQIDEDVLSRFDEVIAEIPALVFGNDEEKTVEALKSLKKFGVKSALCENIGAVFMAKKAGLSVMGGTGLNIMNSLSLKKFSDIGVKRAVVSFESSAANFDGIYPYCQKGLVGYGYLPLMTVRVCPVKGQVGCKGCDGASFITDRKGMRFRVACRDKKFFTVLNSVPLYIGDKKIRSADFYTLYFNFETPEEVAKIYRLFEDGRPLPGDITRGLYFKTLR